MELNVLVDELKQGIANEYDVYTDTLGGFSYKIIELLNAKDGTLTAKIDTGIIVLEPTSVVSVRKVYNFGE